MSDTQVFVTLLAVVVCCLACMVWCIYALRKLDKEKDEAFQRWLRAERRQGARDRWMK